MKNKNFKAGFLLGVILTAVLALGIGAGIYISAPNGATVNDRTKDKMNLIEKLVDAYYLEKIDKDELCEGTYKGMVDGLGDPYSEYFTKKEYEEQMQETSGKYVGIGALVTQDDKTGIISITKVLDDSPAKDAGLKSGDIIAQVEGKDVTGQDLTKVVSKIKGKENTKVKIKILDPKTAKYREVTITRRAVDSPSVASKVIDKKNKIGYIAISEFDINTEEQFKKEIKKLQKKKVKGVIFDLRYNPGGVYDIVCKMLDDILPEGTVVYTKDRDGNKEEQTSDASCWKIPMVVLQNEGSASAAEIFAGAVQDFKAGKVVGTQSYGKGLVQNTFPLSDGSAVKLTVKKYFTPSGKDINNKGITPDVKVENDGKKDLQLEKGKQVLMDSISKK